jgi:hypothetical protein
MLQTAQLPLGDAAWSLATDASAEINQSEVLTSLREHRLPLVRYVGFIAALYPVVVGFNRALIRSLLKVDHVRDAWLVKGLAEQLKEEQIHNDIWRVMLHEYRINHEALWDDLIAYFRQCDSQQLDDLTQRVINAITQDTPNFSPGCFPDATFPEPVLALFHHMYTVAESPSLSFWAHFASQSAIESTIYGCATESVYPGVVGNPNLDRGARSTAWWTEHAQQGGSEARPSTEEKHLHVAKSILNRQGDTPQQAEVILPITKQTLELFSAAIRWHDIDKGGQWDANRYYV